jgi:hypothetical protein
MTADMALPQPGAVQVPTPAPAQQGPVDYFARMSPEEQQALMAVMESQVRSPSVVAERPPNVAPAAQAPSWAQQFWGGAQTPEGTLHGFDTNVATPEQFALAQKAYEKGQAAARKPQKQVQRQEPVKYTEEDRATLRETAYTFDGETPELLQKRIKSGQVVAGSQLPPWLQESAPKVKNLYWYAEDLPPQLVKLFKAESTKPKKKEKK